ncbi:MAG TPA: hypothetical protein VJ371_15925, partial [Streptosporangiaceae bacterium]|nr:hypothetical protein [Streptosporangiaceae bacterium]
RPHASIEGNALAACCRLGLAADPRIQSLAEALISWQWPDGGWNCDLAAAGRSSFHESLAAAWGLHEYWQATGDTAAKDAASRAAELFLAHRLFRTLGSGQVINRAWLAPHYPPYWHYDILQALLVLPRWTRPATPASATPSTSCSGGGCPTAAGNPAAAGGNHPPAPSPPTSRTGAGQARTR